MKTKSICICLLCACQLTAMGKDVLTFGDGASERRHALQETHTESYVGGMGETARRMLPLAAPDWQGGTLSFRMKVNPEAQNYFTVRCWGSEGDDAVVMLFIEGKQLGYRHLGDYDLLHRGNGEAPCPGRFYYTTVPLPLSYTNGKKEVNLELRSYGNTWDYGGTFQLYQHKMEGATVGFYKAYTDVQPCFVPDKQEKQGADVVATAPLRPAPGIEVLDSLKATVSARIDLLIDKDTPLGQQEVWLLADAYSVAWTPAYNNPKVVNAVIRTIDGFYDTYLENPSIITTDATVYNSDWMTTCLLARSIRSLWTQLQDSLDISVNGTVRRENWSRLLSASIDFGITHRRNYTNQSMIIDMAVYECNRALMLMNPRGALPEYQTLRYLYESVALAPWLGKETPGGPERPLGDDYWQLTDKALTRELGFTGYYGEVLDWLVHIYQGTCMPGVPGSGDSKIKDQLLRAAYARYHFRYPAVDEDGYRCYRAEAVVGWRDGNHYPGDIIYGDRGIAWDATPVITAAATLDKRAVGIARKMIDDNQFFHAVALKMQDAGNIRVTQALLHIPGEYELLMRQTPSDEELPMAATAPDYVFADEEDGVVAVKNGGEILYASLYWRARNAVNNLSKVHYITPRMERVANVYIQTKFEESGMYYTRPDWVNMGFAPWGEWYEGLHSAHAGEVLPIARIPDGVKYNPGEENSYAGKADYYELHYGDYVIAMNGSADKTFELAVPKAKRVLDLTDDKKEVTQARLEVAPRTTVVLYMVSRQALCSIP